MYDIGDSCVMLTVVHLLIKLRLETEILMRLSGLPGLIGNTKTGIYPQYAFSLMSFV